MSTTYIPTETRRDLWIKSGARCEFRGCNAPIDRNFLTQERVVLGEYCHIVGDSKDGPRGDAARSAALAKDPANLILCCAKCHKTIDDSKLAGNYTEARLIEMKGEHEMHIQRLYDAQDVKRSIPLVITSRIRGTPTSVNLQHARSAVLQKTGYRRFPSHDQFLISLNDTGIGESESVYWVLAKKVLDTRFDQLPNIVSDHVIEHIEVFGLAQIPVLMYAGFRLGDRVPATIHHAYRDQDNKWHWPKDEYPDTAFSYKLPEEDSLAEIAVGVALTGSVRLEDIAAVVPGMPVATFEAGVKSNLAISKEKDLLQFVKVWRAFLADIHAKYGHIKLHIFPAVPNSVALEMGRSVHPKVMPVMVVWDFVDGSFIQTLRYGADS